MGKRAAERKRKKREEEKERNRKKYEEKCRLERERKQRREAEWRLRSTSSCTSGEYESAEAGPSRRTSDSEVSGEYHSSRQSVSSEDADKKFDHPGLEDISEEPSRDLEMLNTTVEDELEDDVFEEPKSPVAPGQPEKSVPEAQLAKTKDVRRKTPKKRKRRVKRAVTPPDMIEHRNVPQHEPEEELERESPPDNFFQPKSPAWSPRKPPTVSQRFGQLDESSMVSLGRVPQRRQFFREATPPREEQMEDKKGDQEIKEGTKDLGEGSYRSSEQQIVKEIQEEVEEPELAEEPEIVGETFPEAAGLVEDNLDEGVPLPDVEALSEPQIVQEEQKEIESADLEEVVPEEIEDLSEMGAAALLHPPLIVFGDRERIPGILQRSNRGISEAQLAVLMEDIPTSIEYIIPEIIFESVQEDPEEEPFRSRVRLQVEEPSALAKRMLFQNLRRQDSAVQSFDSTETPGSVDTPVSQGDILISWRSSLSDDTGISSALRAQSPQPEREELLEVRSEPGGSRSEEAGHEGRSLSEPRELREITRAISLDRKRIHQERKEMKEAKRQRAILFRRKHGRLGRRISVKTNCLRLTLNNSPENVYQYNAKIERNRPKNLLTNIFRQIREEQTPEPGNCLTFNGRNRIFNLEDLHLGRGGTRRNHVINLNNADTRMYIFCIWNNQHLKLPFKVLKKNKLTNNNSKKWKESIMCIDTVLREALLGDFWVRNVCYFRDGGNHPVRDREIITGYYQKVFTGSYIYLNVDLIKRPFLRNISLTSLMVSMGIDINHPITAEDRRRLRQVLRGLPLFRSDQQGDPWPHLRRFTDILEPATEEVFFIEGLRVFVNDYYQDLNYIMRYPHLPTIRVAGEDRIDSVWPLEFCMILNTRNMLSNLNRSQMKVFVNLNQSNARLRLAELAEMVEQIGYQDVEAVQRYGISIEKDFEEVQARVLRKCNIEYQKKRILSPMDGVWLMTNKQFILPSTMKKLGVLTVNSTLSYSILQKFVEIVKLYGSQKGMIFGRGVIQDALYYNVGKGNRSLYTALQALKQSCDLVIVVLPKENCKEVYKDVKVVSERSLGMLTQCIREEKLRKMRGCVINGLLSQINAKLNGQNYRVQSMASKRLEGNVMVVGGVIMDGGREGAGNQKSRINVAGLAASCDSEGFQHAAIWRYQRRNERTIQSLCNSMFDLINNYQKDRTAKAPSTIIYYRLLPHEEMFDEVEKHERKLIQAACRRIHVNYKPKIIFIGTVRKHRVKFFPEGSDVTLPGLNVLPGTVVDRKIVDRQRHEFFMVSQCVRRGVAKPTKYILSPQCDVKMDKLQGITHHLTHLHALGNQTLAYVPSIHYAFRAAEKGKIFVRGLDFKLSNLLRYNQRKRPKQEFVKKFPMYFL